MAPLAGPLAVALLAVCEVGALEAAVRGVAPEKQSAYGATLKCANFKGAEVELPAAAVNDDFCDCADGSDEPGTGACAGQDSTLFHCPNEGGTPQYVYASRVDDGICDCCDGSDEVGLQARRPNLAKCANFCAEEGAKEREAHAAKLDALRLGMQRKEEAMAKAKVDIAAWKVDVQTMEGQTAALEAALKKAQEAEDVERKADNARKAEEAKAKKAADEAAAAAGGTAGSAAVDDELKKEVEALKVQLNQQKNQITHLQTEVDVLKMQIKKGAKAAPDAPAQPAAKEPAQEEEKKQVSEYAKWMENAGSTPGAIEGEQPSKAEDVPEDLLDEDEDNFAEEYSNSKPTVTSGGQGTAREAADKARQKLDNHKGDLAELRKKLDTMTEDRLGFASLVDQCIELLDGEYTYKVCFFDEAKQSHVRLGSWGKWTGPKQAEFDNGDMCPGGPARKLITDFVCGGENKVLDIVEPSRCVYKARIASPAACDEEEAAKLEKPPVKHPRDEL